MVGIPLLFPKIRSKFLASNSNAGDFFSPSMPFPNPKIQETLFQK